MIRTTTIVIAAGLALTATLPVMPAQAAGAARTFVSAAGSDSNNCANVASPCRHLAAAYAATAPNGEIYVLDPANYGSLTITGPVSIEGHGWASIAPVTGNAAITVSAPGATDKINIIGVVLDGTGLANTSGIVFNSGGSLTIQDSVIRNFTQDGIDFAPNTSSASNLSVLNTLISDNGVDGIVLSSGGSGNVSGVLDHVKIINSGDTGFTTVSLAATVNVTIADCVIANSTGPGVFANSVGGPDIVMVRNSTIANNGQGLSASTISAAATVRVTRSTITGNTTGWFVGGTGAVLSYGDNNIDGNGSANTEPPNPLVYH